MKVRLLALVTLALIVTSTQGAFPSEYGSIRGTVVDAGTGDPIEGANVLLLGTIMGAAADANGEFTISNVPPGWYTVVVSSIGYKQIEEEVLVVTGTPVEVDVAMEETVVELGGLVVTASKYHQALREVPVSMSLLQSKDILRRNVSTVNEALKFVPGVTTMGSQINIRGASGFSRGIGTRVLVLLDGVPFIRGDDNDVDWDAIATSQIEQVEVMKGAGSALYGSSALGGVVNVVLKEPKESYNFFVRTFSGFYDKPKNENWVWTDTRRHFEGTTLSYSGNMFGVGAWIASTWRNNSGYRENDDNKTLNLMSKFDGALNPNIHMKLLAGYSKRRSGFFLFWRSYNEATQNGGDPEGTATRATMTETYFHPSITHTLGSNLSYAIKGRYHRTSSNDRREVIDPSSGYEEGEQRRSSANSYGAEAQINYQYAPQGILVMGIDGQVDRVNSIQYSNPKALKYATYIQNEYRLWPRLKATVGARYDAQAYDDTLRTGQLNPKLGMTYTLSPLTTLRTSVAKGFRAASVAEKFISTVTNQIKVSPNPDLEPERSVSAEVGLNHTLMDAVNFDVAAYHSDFWDLIEVRPQPGVGTIDGQPVPVVKFMNVTRARVEGIETSCKIEWLRNLLTTDISYSYIDSKDLSCNPDGSPSADYGRPLKYRSSHLLFVASDISYRSIGAGIDFRYVSPIERVDDFEKVAIKDLDVTPATYVTDLRFALEWGSFKFHFFVNNLFQYYYLEHPAGLGPFRNYTLQVDFIS